MLFEISYYCPMMFEYSATGSLSLPAVVNTETQVDDRWEITSAVDVAILRDVSILNLTVV